MFIFSVYKRNRYICVFIVTKITSAIYIIKLHIWNIMFIFVSLLIFIYVYF